MNSDKKYPFLCIKKKEEKKEKEREKDFAKRRFKFNETIWKKKRQKQVTMIIRCVCRFTI